ncbi:MAG: hypothetical protein ACLUD0_07080 [Eubacterium ramulus]
MPGNGQPAEDESLIREIVGDNDTDMVDFHYGSDVGRCDYKHSIKDRADSPVGSDLVRLLISIRCRKQLP